MKKTLSIVALLFFTLVLSGCTGKDERQLLPDKDMSEQSKTELVAPTLKAETSEPDTTNDLPTVIDEAEIDLEVLDNDMKEIEKLDLEEEAIEL